MKPTRTTPRPRLLTGLFCLFGLSLLPATGFGQGCVIARGGGGAMTMDEHDLVAPKHWQASFAFRWFESDRHFVGDVEQPQRKAQGTQVINNSFFYDFTASYGYSDRLSLSVTVPFVYHDRSSKYEHSGNDNPRYHTQAAGLADMRVGASYWLFDPKNDQNKGNLAVGFGLKAPTGDYKARDIFFRRTGPEERYVDSSIQPGDGGWGYSVELQGFYRLRENLTAYGTAFYLFNPEGRVEETGFSIPDAYMARGGFDYMLPFARGVSVSLGGRIEGVPGNDMFGNSHGRRRPGFSVAVEPGVSFSKGNFSGTLTIPIAVHRNRTTSFGSTRAGDAAFADFSINAGLSYRL